MPGLSTSGLRSEENLESSGISREPYVSFVLRNILEVPEVPLEGYLRHLGDPLEEWGMDLCETCEETVVKAKQIYQEMQDAKKRFKEVKFEIISKIMSIQQGIKCGDKEPEVGIETIEIESGVMDNLQEPVGQLMDEEAEELPGQELELEAGDESALDNSAILCSQKIHQQQLDFSTGECKTEIPGIAEDENLMEFEYHFKTEQQLSSECADTTEEPVPAVENVLELGSNSNRFRTSAKVRSKSSKRNRTKSHKSTVLATPKVKGTLKDPEKLFRCETCFRKEPGNIQPEI